MAALFPGAQHTPLPGFWGMAAHNTAGGECLPWHCRMHRKTLKGGTLRPGGTHWDAPENSVQGTWSNSCGGASIPPLGEDMQWGAPHRHGVHAPSVQHYPSQLFKLPDSHPSVPGVQSPCTGIFFLPPQPRLRWQKEKKIPCHRTGGHNHNPAVTQAPGAMLLWPKGPVAEFRRYPIAAVCPHVRIGGQRAAPAVAVLCVPTPTAAAAAVYCPKIFSRIGLCTPGVGVYT